MKVLQLLKEHTIRPRKRLGQNFLTCNNIRNKMCDALNLTSNDTVVEIGAGSGMVTEALAQKARHVYAIECDERLCALLLNDVATRFRNVTVIPKSILNVDLAALLKNENAKVIGNLPYYITSKILFYLADYRKSITQAVLTMQKEVAGRLTATPGKKTYGRLTVSMRYIAEIERLFDIKPSCFYPAPDVTSSVITLQFRPTLAQGIDEKLFLDVVEALFQERRKRIVNSLCLLKSSQITKEKATEIITSCCISPSVRAEELMIKDFIAITKAVNES